MDHIFSRRPSGEPASEGVASPMSSYDPVSQWLHWLTAVLIFVAVPLGLIAANIHDGPFRSALLDDWHKPIGVTVIVLSLFRLGWRARMPAPPGAAELRAWERAAARAGHVFLYLMLFLMPLSGVMMSQGGGRPISYFGLFDLPQLLPLDPSLGPRQQYYYKVGKWLHEEVFSWALYLAFAFHMAGVIKHRFIDGDRRFLWRMWNRRRRG